MELRRYLTLILRWWWLLAAGTLIAGGAAYAVSRSQTKLYTATATVLVNQAQGAAGSSYNDILASERLTQTYAQLITTEPVKQQVAQNLAVDLKATDTSLSAAAQPNTQLIKVSSTSADPELAARAANEAARVFGDQIAQAQLGVRVGAITELEREVRDAERAVSDREADVSRLTGRPPGLPEDQRLLQLGGAQAQLEIARQNLSQAQRELQQSRLEVGGSINSVVTANPAVAPSSPSSPRTLFNVILGALVGLLLVTGVVAALEYLDDTVSDPEEVERATGLPTLGAIRRIPGTKRTRRPGLPALQLDAKSPLAEAYRIVRTNLEFARSGNAGRTMLITSSLPGEGKSTSVANLGAILAQTGRRIILVDADLRRPTLHKQFGLPNSTGLSTLFVMDRPSFGPLLRPTPIENLYVLPSGPLPPNPAELLASERMSEIIEQLEAEADLVVFDSPPVLGVADTSTLVGRVSGTLLVVDAGRTRAGALQQAVESLQRANATIWGVVLNKVRTRPGSGYYYYSYGSPGQDDEPPRPTTGVAPRPAPARPRRVPRETA